MKARQEITGAVTLAARHRVATAAAAVLAPTSGLSVAGWKLRLTVTALPAS
jgi:hypothetical protein